MIDETTLAFAVLYLRVSSAGQAEAGTSLETQETTGRQEAARRGLRVVGVHADEVSGALYSRRSGLQAALSQIEGLRAQYPGVPACLIVAKYDRSARDIGIQREIERRLQTCGATLLSCDGTPGENTAPARLFRTLRGGFAEFERDIIRERTVEGRLARARAGYQPAPRLRPFGYRVILRADVYPGSPWSAEDVGRYVVIPEEAQVVTELFARYGRGEWSLRGAVRALIARGVPTVHGGKWCPPTLWNLLQNPVYVGRARYNRREILRSERADGTIAYGKRDRAPEEIIHIPCPAIVSEAAFAAVAGRLAANRQAFGSTPERRHLLSGLLRCPSCGRGLFGRTKAMVGGSVHHYKCDRGTRDGGCDRRHWQGDQLEALVIGAVAHVAASPQVLAHALQEARTRRRRHLADRDALQKQAAECRRRESLLVAAQVEALSEGRDDAPYRAALQEVGARRAAIEEQIALAFGGEEKGADIDASQIAQAVSALDTLLVDARLPLLERANALRQVVAQVRPFDAGPGRDGRCNPAVGVEIELYGIDGVERITLRATPSADGAGVSIHG